MKFPVPKVSLKTKRAGDKVLITITAHGKGIPEKLAEKIFQSFFIITRPGSDCQ
jgi:signal transduction histidine kinase